MLGSTENKMGRKWKQDASKMVKWCLMATAFQANIKIITNKKINSYRCYLPYITFQFKIKKKLKIRKGCTLSAKNGVFQERAMGRCVSAKITEKWAYI